VIESALKGLTKLTELNLFKKNTLLDLSKIISQLLHHPNKFIRYNSISFLSESSKILGVTDTNCFLLKFLKNHLKFEISTVNIKIIN
jgi:phosphoinositide-3-kinase regulatory subunit 4